MLGRRFGILVFGVVTAVVAGAACGNGATGSSSASSSSGGSSSSTSPASSGTGDTTSSSSSSSSGDTTSSSSSSSSGSPIGHCKRGCATAADCCAPGQPNCPSNKYPTNPTCDQGACTPPQCAADGDCTGGGPGSVCKLVKGLKSCVQPCVDSQGCSAPATCAGVAMDSSKFCAVVDPPCANDVDCGASGKCQSTVCVCGDDSFCGGAGHCQAGDCVCTTDGDCTAALANHCAH